MRVQVSSHAPVDNSRGYSYPLYFLVIGVRKIKNIKSQAYYNKIVIFKNKVKIELPTILISLFLFLTLWIFFGKYNVILPPFLTLFLR